MAIFFAVVCFGISAFLGGAALVAIKGTPNWKPAQLLAWYGAGESRLRLVRTIGAALGAFLIGAVVLALALASR